MTRKGAFDYDFACAGDHWINHEEFDGNMKGGFLASLWCACQLLLSSCGSSPSLGACASAQADPGQLHTKTQAQGVSF